MERTISIFTRSIHTFYHNYQYFTSITAILLLPVSDLGIKFFSFSLLPTIQIRHRNLSCAGFSPSSHFFFLLKLSQTISSSVFSTPFNLIFLLVAKSAIIQALHNKTLPCSLLSLYNHLLTYLCNSYLICPCTIFFSFF